jgi:hypothetical protein
LDRPAPSDELPFPTNIPRAVPAAVRELAETVRTLDRYFEHREEEPP